MRSFVRIGTDDVYTGEYPTAVEVLDYVHEPTPHSVLSIVTQDSPEWTEALKYYMLHRGYCYPEDNVRDRPLVQPAPVQGEA